MRMFVILLFVAAVWSTGCRSSDTEEGGPVVVENPYYGQLQDGSAPISFDIDQVFGAEEEPVDAILQMANRSVIDAAGNVYVLEMGRLVSFAKDGSVRWIRDEQGNAPGELRIPGQPVFDNHETIWLSNQAGSRLDAFDLDGRPIDSIPVSSFDRNRLGLIGFVNDSTAVGTVDGGNVFSIGIVVIRTREPWEIIREFRIDQTHGDHTLQNMRMPPSVALLDGAIAVTNWSRYEVSLLDLEGDTLKLIRRDVPDFLRPGLVVDGGVVIGRPYSSTRIPVRLASGHYLVQAYWATNVDDPEAFARRAVEDQSLRPENHYTLDLYDSDWNLLYSIEGDEYDELSLGQPHYVSSDGYLYASRYTPYPGLIRYAVRVNAP